MGLIVKKKRKKEKGLRKDIVKYFQNLRANVNVVLLEVTIQECEMT